MTESSNPPASQSPEADDHEISLLDLLIVLAKHKKLILGLPFVVAVIAAGYSLMIPNIYTANTIILPPQQSQSTASAFLAQLGEVAGLVGTSGKSSGAVYVAMLNSRTVADGLIERFGLMKSSGAKYRSQVREDLAELTRITTGKNGTITIAVDNKDPKRAAELANAYVDELVRFSNVLAVTEASQRRLFFERQLVLAKDNLSKAEAAARHALQTGGLVKVDDQGRAMVEVAARLSGQIKVKEVEIGVMRTFATDRNPDLQRAHQELASLKRELAKIEGTDTKIEGTDTRSATDSQSGQGSNSLNLLRDVKYHEIVFELLAKQYELAKIDEAKDPSVIQVMDKAIAPDFRSKPKRTIIVLLSALAAGCVGIMWAFVREAMARISGDPRQAGRLQTLRRYIV